jgi:hypothetical protein
LIARKFQTVEAREVVPTAAQAACRMKRRREISMVMNYFSMTNSGDVTSK